METNLLMNIEESSDIKVFEKYLLQINRIKLIDYIQCGLIIPDKYLGDECEKDIQSKNKNLLTLSDGYIDELNEEQILLELMITNNEKLNLDRSGEICYLDMPLPISRIEKIYVQDKDIVKHIEAQINTSESGFLPSDLFDTYKNRKKIKFEQKKYSDFEKEDLQDYNEEIRTFDKRMGMFTFMKNTNLYYREETKSISNYSEHYFSSLSLLLKEEEKKEFENKPFELFDILDNNKEFKSLLFSNSQIDKEFIDKTAETIEDIELKEIFLELQKPVGIRKTLPLLLEKNALNLYLIALVYYFKDKSGNRKDSFKIEIEELIPYQAAEVSLAILGLYFGYKRLRASENIDIKDSVFKKIFGKTFPMKFTLTTKLDYVTIEAIYNVCFKDEKGFNTEYISNLQTKSKIWKITKDVKFKRWYEIIEDKEYFEQKNIKIVKKTFEQILLEKFEKLSEDLVSSKDGVLLGFVLKCFSSIISPVKFGEKFQISCKKSDLYEKLKVEENDLKREKILDLFDLNGKL